jgi:hypothetical protein
VHYLVQGRFQLGRRFVHQRLGLGCHLVHGRLLFRCRGGYRRCWCVRRCLFVPTIYHYMCAHAHTSIRTHAHTTHIYTRLHCRGLTMWHKFWFSENSKYPDFGFLVTKSETGIMDFEIRIVYLVRYELFNLHVVTVLIFCRLYQMI